MYNPKNSTQIIGYVGRDAELRFTPNGSAVSDFSIAVSEKWTSKDGEKHEETTWYKVTMWKEQAQSMAQYITKGKLLMVVGKVKAEAYLKDGEAVASLVINNPSITFLGGNGAAYEEEQGEPAPAPKAQQPTPKQQKPQQPKPASAKKEEAPWDMPAGAGELSF